MSGMAQSKPQAALRNTVDKCRLCLYRAVPELTPLSCLYRMSLGCTTPQSIYLSRPATSKAFRVRQPTLRSLGALVPGGGVNDPLEFLPLSANFLPKPGETWPSLAQFGGAQANVRRT